MPKRQKHQRLPNGFGSIRYLGKGRRNPYAVHPPGDIDGNRPPALCYVDTWMKGFAVLTAYKAGTYTPDMLADMDIGGDESDRIIADYNRIKGIHVKGQTFSEVYEGFYKWKYEQPGSKQYSEASKQASRSAYSHCKALYDKEFASLRYADLQGVIDSCPLRHASLELIVSLFHQMYAYADLMEIADKDYSSHVKINIEDDDEHGVPFSDEELAILWRHREEPTVEMLLIMCYSGFRISAYKDMKVDMDDWYFQGGIKTAAGKDRIVPIHSVIQPLVKCRMDRQGGMLTMSTTSFRMHMAPTLESLGIEPHTPHDCRHTFSRLCEKYGVNENDRKRMLGHSFGNDITNGIYGHRTLEELRAEIEKIICDFCVTDRPQ